MSEEAFELPAGHRLVHLTETASTNAEAMRLAVAGERGPVWILADRQTGGRGRSGRSWASLPGNLHASMLFSAASPLGVAGQLSLVAGVAVIDALRAAGTFAAADAPRLKWPNDILIGNAKLGGILIESTSNVPGPGISVIVGVGLNLAAAPEDLGRAATFLAAHGLALSPKEALCFLAGSMQSWLDRWAAGAGFAEVRSAWLARAGEAGEPLVVHSNDGTVEGRFAGIDADGALIIAGTDGRERRFTFGDVTLAQGDSVGR
jgi:BirA family biotin operon repressor/biotin-[acetyl-CoA-carboxylase] ligase